MKALTWVVIIVVVLLLAAGWQLGVNSDQKAGEGTPGIERDLMEIEPDFIERELASSPVPEVAIEEVKLAAVGGYTGMGEAARSWDGKVFGHVVTADLPDPPSDKFYEGWLVDSESSPSFFSTGRMTRQETKYALIYMAEENFPEYNEVVITEESIANGLDGKPETHVLEGSF